MDPSNVLSLKGGGRGEIKRKERGEEREREKGGDIGGNILAGSGGVFSAMDSRKPPDPFLEAWTTHRHGILQKCVHLAELQVHVSPANSPQKPLEGSHPLPVYHASCEPRW